MTYWIIYLLKVIAIHGAFFLFYWLFLKNTKRHHFNRFFLLVGLVVAFSIPFIELPAANTIPILSESNEVVTWLNEPALDYEIVLSPIEEQTAEWSFWIFIPVLYVSITVFFLTRSILALISLSRLRKYSEKVKNYWFNLFKTSHSRPFSFFSNVFIPKTLFGSEDFDQVLAHECVHVKQRHSIDRLLLDFVVSLFWFNPFMYLYRNALIEIHEYQADEAVVQRFKDPIRYQEILFSQLQTPQYSGMVSHFNVSTIKKRIVMMNKHNKKSGWIYLVSVPLTLMLIFAFSSKQAMKPIEEIGTEIADKVDKGLDFDLPKIDFQKDYEPSILPLKNAENIRMTSAYGMRIHPIYKVEKMHLGVDFSCKEGSEVVATADGIVQEIKTTFEGYGKRITLNHGDKYQTTYAQLSEFKVNQGDKVKRGDVIAFSGNSGASTAPHLHYEIIDVKTGKRIDPKPFINNYQFKILIKEIPSMDDHTSEAEQRQKEEAERARNKQLKELESIRLSNDEDHRRNEVLRKEEQEKRLIEEKKMKRAPLKEKTEVLRKEQEERKLMAEKLKEEQLAFQVEQQELIKKDRRDGIDDGIENTSKNKNKDKQKQINKSKKKASSKDNEDPRLSRVLEFLKGYEGDQFNSEDWKIVFKDDKVKLKRSGSLEGITLYQDFFENEKI